MERAFATMVAWFRESVLAGLRWWRLRRSGCRSWFARATLPLDLLHHLFVLLLGPDDGLRPRLRILLDDRRILRGLHGLLFLGHVA